MVAAILKSASVSLANSRMLFTLGEELVDVLGEDVGVLEDCGENDDGVDAVGDGIDELVVVSTSSFAMSVADMSCFSILPLFVDKIGDVRSF